MSRDTDNQALEVRLQLLRARRHAAELAARLGSVEQEVAEARSAVQQLHESIAFGLGRALIDSVRSPRTLLALPARVAKLIGIARGRIAEPALAPRDSSEVPTPRREAREATQAPAVLGRAGDVPSSLRGLRIAAVLDTFSADSLGPDCELLLLRAEDWAEQIEAFKPHLLLVESCWHGTGRTWEGLVSNCSDTLRSLVASCRDAGIPTVFWNKEDPLHYEAFIESASLFDLVFTTDADSIPHYKRDFGHERVYLMPFALQPRMFHPIADRERQNAFFFAGAYYPHLVERSRDFRALADALSLAGPVHIYDRNHGLGANTALQYPEPYRDMVRGGVPYAEMADLYRSYRFGVNVNTIKQSPTMFARRVFELIGCGCGVFSNYSAGVAGLFGELVLATDDDEEALRLAWSEYHAFGDDEVPAYRRVAALRKVLSQHTYAHRLGYIAGKAGLALDAPALPKVAVVARVRDADELARVLAASERQSLRVDLLLLDLPDSLQLDAARQHARTLRRQDLEGAAREQLAGYWIAPFDPDDYYGEHYLQDLMLATRYSAAQVIGKASYRRNGVEEHQGAGLEYRKVSTLAWRRLVVAAEACPGTVEQLLDAIHSGRLSMQESISIDCFSYVEDGAPACAEATTEPSLDAGVDMADALSFAEAMPPLAVPAKECVLDQRQLFAALQQGVVPAGTSVALRRDRIELCAKLADKRREVLQSQLIRMGHPGRDGLRICVQARPDPAISYAIDLLAEDGAVLGNLALPAGVTVSAKIPDGAAGFRFCVSLQGTLTRYLDALLLGDSAPPPLFLPGEGRLLVVTNIYPRQGKPYRNAFVHRRVLEYRRRGVPVDVVCVGEGVETSSYRHDGVLVHLCDPAVLRETLKVSGHVAIAVHFLNERMWEGLRDAASHTRTVVWLHGAEVQPYARRAFNYSSQAEHDKAMHESAARTEFWRRLLAAPPANLELVFVSRTFAEQTFEDLGGLDFPRWRVIHNPIQDGLFSYLEKSPEARMSILSVRPHDSRIYANDLVAAVIRGLSAYPEFSALKFHLVGEGALFEENFSGLADFPNVSIERRLLRQEEVAELHRAHGVFLVPTRGDTQGVSRDEAMASGLVPVTNLVGSVAEFVDSRVAVLAAAEDVDAMVAGIRQLIADPQLYQRMSRAAAARVREQSGVAKVVDEELRVLGMPRPAATDEFDRSCN